MYRFIHGTPTQEDTERYRDFFNGFLIFNELNTDPLDNDTKNFISRITSRDTEKVIYLEDRPVFYMNSRKMSGYDKIYSMIFEPGILSADYRDGLIDEIRENIFLKKGIFGNGPSYIYTVRENEMNSYILGRLGLKVEKYHRLMEKDMTVPIEDLSHVEEDEARDLSIIKVSTALHRQHRVDVQNLIFENRKRIPITIEDVNQEFSNPSYQKDLAFLMFQKETPVGYGQVVRYGGDYVLVNFGIIPEYRGRGYSDFLLTFIMRRLKELKVPVLKLEVFHDNDKAIGLYEKHGFRSLYNVIRYVSDHEE